MTRYRGSERGFTLIEMLVVLSIMLLLSGMLMPLVGMARRSSLRTVTQAIMGKTEAALYQFKADYGGYPYQRAYAADGEPWTNALGYNLGTDIATPDQQKVKDDMKAAAAGYAYPVVSNYGTLAPVGPPAGPNTFVNNRRNNASSHDSYNSPEGDFAPSKAVQAPNNGPWLWQYGEYTDYRNTSVAGCVLLNRLAAQRAKEAMLIGAVDIGGVVMPEIDSGPAYGNLKHNGRDLSGTKLVPTPESDKHPGWAKDYLQGQIDAKYLRGDAILDAYHRPLIYICQVVPGCEATFGHILDVRVDIPDMSPYGLQPLGRRALRSFQPGTTTPIAADPDTLPDTGNLMHSDMRSWAPPGYELEFELWSAGPDGRFGWWRDDPANRDNLSCQPYNKVITGTR